MLGYQTSSRYSFSGSSSPKPWGRRCQTLDVCYWRVLSYDGDWTDLCDGCVEMEIDKAGHDQLVCAIYRRDRCIAEDFIAWGAAIDGRDAIALNLNSAWIVKSVLVV